MTAAHQHGPSGLTRHLESLQVPEVLHCHLQDVRLLQFGVSGALSGQKVTS